MGARSSPGAEETIHAPWRSPGRGPGAAKLWSVRTRARFVAPLFLSLLSVPVVLAGCGSGAADQESAASSGSAAESSVQEAGSLATAEDGATVASAFQANTDPDTTDASADASVTVRDIRLGRQDGFDRVVFEVGGTGTPGWDARYVDAASSQGSGEAVDVAGAAILQLSLTGAGYPYETGVREYSAAGPLTARGTQIVTEVVYDATFEGTTMAFVGTKAREPFRVYLLQNPTRVVLEVADAS
jgi:hypothetical protein